ncbi:MAG TPA: amidohydrolase family protein [Polyangiaceae bacterium]
MSTNRKSRPEPDLVPPLDFHPPSNGEFCPVPASTRAVEAERRFWQMVEEKHRRLGMTRREFVNSSCGFATALLAINQAACSSSERTDPNPRTNGGGATSGCGPAGCGSSGTSGMGSGGRGGMGGAGGTSSGGRGGGGMSSGGRGGTANSGGTAGYMVDAGMTEDAGMADAGMMPTGDFIFDVQTHVSTEIEEPWGAMSPDERALDFITQIFVQSETDVAVLSGPPGARDLGAPNVAARAQVQEIINRLAGTRLLIHANAELERGPSELDYMSELAEEFNPAAWKMYPHEGELLLDSDELGGPFVERARALGILMVAGHRGLWDDGGYTAKGSPADMVRTAAAAPDLNFLIYHSGYERMTDENHAYDPDAADHFGVDRLIRALHETEIGATGNVYAELGSTWANIMTEPEQAAHVLGKLLVTLGPDRILWGTDCVYNGIPQSQILAFRMFQIPEPMREEFGYPELTAEIKAKIFGLNAARIYGIDIDAMRREITADDVAGLRTAFLNDPASVPVPDRRRYEGPRTRRQFLQLLERDRFFRRHG